MAAEVDRKMQERNLSALVRNEGFQFTDTFFPYTSGQIGPYYIQSVVVENSGRDYVTACNDITHLVKSKGDFEVISGGESRDWDFSNIVSYILEKPHLKIYKDGKIIGAKNFYGKNIAHVADLNNEGSSVRDLWVPAIKKGGGEIKDVFFYVDRMEDGVQVMKDLGLNSHSVVPLDEHAWDYLQQKEVITNQVYNSQRTRMENKNLWAKEMLRSERGFNELVKLIINPHTKPKVEKILTKGYPEIKEELVGRLNERVGYERYI